MVLVRDSQGRKMVNPWAMVLTLLKLSTNMVLMHCVLLVTGNAPGNDMGFYMERVEANRNFANKIWNASKFVLMNLTNYDEKLCSNCR